MYRPVIHTDLCTGDNTVWATHRKMLQDNNIDSDPRQHIIDSICADVTIDIEKNRMVIIGGDFNENIFSHNLSQSLESIGLINLAKTYVPGTTARSYSRGSKLIDGVWVSKQVFDCVLAFGYAPFNYIVPSDHRGMYIDFDIYKLLDDHFPSICPPSYRRLKSTIPSRVELYLQSLEQDWENHNITLKIDQLEDYLRLRGDTLTNVKLLNKIDDQIQRILTCTEKQCCKVGKDACNLFSVPLAKLLRDERHKLCQINKYYMSQSFKYGSKNIKKLQNELRSI